eukprot:352178-Chlamydomonas_euryale.AAC.5
MSPRPAPFRCYCPPVAAEPPFPARTFPGTAAVAARRTPAATEGCGLLQSMMLSEEGGRNSRGSGQSSSPPVKRRELGSRSRRRAGRTLGAFKAAWWRARRCALAHFPCSIACGYCHG